MNDEQVREKVKNLTNTLLRLERYLAGYAQHQVYGGEINIWQDQIKDVLVDVSNKIQTILKSI